MATGGAAHSSQPRGDSRPGTAHGRSEQRNGELAVLGSRSTVTTLHRCPVSPSMVSPSTTSPNLRLLRVTHNDEEALVSVTQPLPAVRRRRHAIRGQRSGGRSAGPGSQYRLEWYTTSVWRRHIPVGTTATWRAELTLRLPLPSMDPAQARGLPARPGKCTWGPTARGEGGQEQWGGRCQPRRGP